jgi:hypothetical protein
MAIHVNYLENGHGIEIIASGTVTGEFWLGTGMGMRK